MDRQAVTDVQSIEFFSKYNARALFLANTACVYRLTSEPFSKKKMKKIKQKSQNEHNVIDLCTIFSWKHTKPKKKKKCERIGECETKATATQRKKFKTKMKRISNNDGITRRRQRMKRTTEREPKRKINRQRAELSRRSFAHFGFRFLFRFVVLFFSFDRQYELRKRWKEPLKQTRHGWFVCLIKYNGLDRPFLVSRTVYFVANSFLVIAVSCPSALTPRIAVGGMSSIFIDKRFHFECLFFIYISRSTKIKSKIAFQIVS